MTADQEQQDYSLLIVHGRDFKPAAETYLELSHSAMRKGVERDYPERVADFDALHVDVAWYGDLNEGVLAARGKTYDEKLDVGDRRNMLKALSQIAPRKRFGIRMYDKLPGKSALPEFFMDVGATVSSAVGLRMPVIGRMAKDFAAYLDNQDGFADDARERVRAKICALMDAGKHIMLVTHGTGSVIAYDVLWELSNDTETYPEYGDCKIDQWVTLGSPLGDRTVQKRLLGAQEREEARFPSNVISWNNLSAEDDYTCHDATLADDFKTMLRQRNVSAVHDYRVFNLAVRYGKSNPHSSIGYYIHPRLTKIVVDWLDAT